ncbi:hypothetical protein NHQ30_009491 [Ciborinia camelliae]|nr:hypothetical protein NHQ30_009491 [Ciborinia camelliae]
MHSYEAALKDSEFVPAISDRTDKALYRGALALYALGRYNESAQLMKVTLERSPDNLDAQREYERVKLRVHESRTGEYNFGAMYESAKVKPYVVDCATFEGPIEIRDSKIHGKGLFTTRAVKAGELLLCEKSFVYDNQVSFKLLYDLATEQMTRGANASLVDLVTHKLFNNPSLAPLLFDLSHGSYKPTKETEIDDLPILDTFLVSKIISLNMFNSPTTSKSRTLQDFKDASPSVDADFSDIFKCSGVYLLASRINHSCLPNCSRAFIANVQLIHATSDLDANTEWLFEYYHRIPVDEPTVKAKQPWAFICKCVECQADQVLPSHHFDLRRSLARTFKEARRNLSDLPSSRGNKRNNDFPL